MNSYKLTFRFYDIAPKTAYVKAENMAEAAVIGHRFITPDDDCRAIEADRVRKADVPEYTPVHRIREPRTEKEMSWALRALIYAEKRGIYEYTVSGSTMEYWSLYEDGFWKSIVNLDDGSKKSERKIPWTGPECIPEFLENPVTGATRYNYMVG